MSDLYNTIQSLHLHNSNDSDTEDSENESCDSQEGIYEMSEKMEKSGRLPLPIGNITIESPTNFGVNTDVRNGGSSVGKHTDALQINDGDLKNPRNQYVNSRSVSFTVQQEKLAKGDSQLSTSPQRKLPIPHAAMNTNPNLKGILIKPKRILPAQPDLMKAKSAQNRLGAKTEDKLDHGLTLCGDAVSQEQTSSGDSDDKQANRTPLDVQKIKSYFAKNGAELIKTKTKDTDETKVLVDSGDIDTAAKRSQSECGYVAGGYLIREQTIYDLNETGNMSKVEDDGSSGKELSNKTVPTEANATRSLERGIRSPSPKSNTTWDRSSSGYSSDERPDPRSPPPVSSSGASSKHSLDTDDDNIVLEIETAVEKLAVGDDKLLSPDIETDIKNLDYLHSESAIAGRENVMPVCSHTLTGATSVTPQPLKCNVDIISKNKTDLGPQTYSSAFDSMTPGRQQPIQKPVWTLPNKIMYRKSGSEPMIHLRHSVRQQYGPETHGGLEVLGKSYKQSNVSALNPQGEGETEVRPEIPSPGGKDNQSNGATEADLTLDLSQCEERGQEAAKTRILRQQLMTLKSPRDMKNMSMNVGLSTPKDEKDIRKSLHDLNSPKRRSPAMKAMPIRARHTIHVTPPNVPISEGVTKSTEVDTKSGIKFFGKKMWRAPSGQPDGPENRPFSPFGGTLPPAKINEKKKKTQEYIM